MPMKKPVQSDSSDDSDGFSPSGKRVKLEKNPDDYVQRRERNNIAVRKSREKSRAKARETVQQVDKLRKENEMLEQKVTILSKELTVFKDLVLVHAGTVNDNNCPSQAFPTMVVQVTSNDHKYSASMKPEN